MARPRKTTSEDTRTRAIEAADALLHQHGYLGVSMEAIAKQVGVRKASLYHHFPAGKDQIMLEIGERLIEFNANGFQNALTGRTVRERLEAMAAFIFQDTNRTNNTLIETMRFMPEEHQQRIGTLFYQQMFAKVHEVFEAGTRDGELRQHDTRLSAHAFLSLLSEMNRTEHQMTDMLLIGLNKTD
jgi:AcrR family transcriptional regulator